MDFTLCRIRKSITSSETRNKKPSLVQDPALLGQLVPVSQEVLVLTEEPMLLLTDGYRLMHIKMETGPHQKMEKGKTDYLLP